MTAQNPLRLQWLDPRNPKEPFPSVDHALRDPNGLLAIGGDLSVHRLLSAYSQGIFPWFNPDEPILWWAPDPRAVLYCERLHVSRSLQRRLRREDHAVTLDRAFDEVITACSEQRAGGTWLGGAMQLAYLELFRRGHAHSVEVWRDGKLIGGLYGVVLGRMFFGESMFSRATDGSKIALYYLCRQLLAWDMPLLDCQVGSAHLQRMGAELLPRELFQKQLGPATASPGRPLGSWRFDIEVPQSATHLKPPAHQD